MTIEIQTSIQYIFCIIEANNNLNNRTNQQMNDELKPHGISAWRSTWMKP